MFINRDKILWACIFFSFTLIMLAVGLDVNYLVVGFISFGCMVGSGMAYQAVKVPETAED